MCWCCASFHCDGYQRVDRIEGQFKRVSPFCLWVLRTCLFDVLVSEYEFIPSIERLSLVATSLELRSGQSEMSAKKESFTDLV